eukprot:COSAG02_NODE_1046_length_14984_cov_12.231844_9_plen_45_part_00
MELELQVEGLTSSELVWRVVPFHLQMQMPLHYYHQAPSVWRHTT